jgi:hypothetical protein
MAQRQPNSHDTPRRRRLLGQIEGVRQDLERRVESAGRSAVPWKPYAEASLATASQAVEDGDDQGAWMHLHRAKRFLYESYDDDERLARARVLRAETDEKLTGWRKQAVTAVLPLDAKTPGTGALVLAQFLLDEHFENVYFKLEMLGQRIRQLPWLLGAIVILLLLGAWWLSADPGSSILLPPRELLLVLLLGAAGAGVSIALSMKQLSGRIPEVLRGWTETSVRPLVGALSAVILVVVAQSGLLPIEARGNSQLYAYAVLGGFSDQLLVRLLAAAGKAVTKEG